jgi:hypothetical protein
MRQPQAAKLQAASAQTQNQDDEQRQEQAERRRDLDPGGVEAAAMSSRACSAT